jgi:peptidylprolyl isomerase
MKTRPIILALAGAFLAAQVSAADLPAPAWLAGDWCGDHGTQRLDERWTPPADDALFAVSRTFENGKLAVFEFLRIERKDGVWEFVAQPGGSAPTRFAEVERGEQRIAFANPQHDFPQRIEYWRDAAGLHAAVEGPGKDGTQRIAYDFKAGACAEPAGKLTMGQVLEQTTAADWRTPDPARVLYLDLPSGRVIIELAPDFAPKHVANLQALVRERYFDGLAILRSQDNFVVQWGDPNAEDEKTRKSVGTAQRMLPAEFERAIDPGLAFTALPDRDGYAPEVGFSGSFPSGRDTAAGKAWLAHCYGTLGVGRDTGADSGGGTELYVVTGHAPRQLDRNITVVGRVLKGMELLSTLPRGTAPLGFYEKPEQRTPIKSIRLAADVPESERVALQVMRTDTASFQRLVEARRNRGDEWYKRPAGYIDLCSVPVPVR